MDVLTNKRFFKVDFKTNLRGTLHEISLNIMCALLTLQQEPRICVFVQCVYMTHCTNTPTPSYSTELTFASYR